MITFSKEEIPRSVLGIDKQESSIRKEKAAFNNFIKYCQKQGINQFKFFDKEVIQFYLDYRQGKKMSAKTRKEELRLIKKFIKWAKKKSFFTDDPAEGIIIPKPKNKNPRFFSEKELQKIFDEASEPYRSIFRFLYLTGLRTGELTNLEWRDYNEKTRILTIRVVEADKKKRQPGNKTKREGSIPINDAAHEILMKRKASGESDVHIFLNQAENRLDDENIYRNLLPILDKLKIPEASPHTFRHTFASHLVIAGVSIYIVKELLRHASVRETEIYSHLSQESTRAAVDIIGQKMEKEIDNNKQVEEEL
jgi:site-specific recombinase XerD